MATVGDYTYVEDSFDNRAHALAVLSKTLTTGVGTTLDVASVLYNVGGLYTSGNTFTIPVDGIYEVGMAIRYATNATGSRQARLDVDASTAYYYVEKTALSGQNTNLGFSIEEQFTSGQVISFAGLQASGGNLALTGYNRGWIRLLVES